MASIKFPRKEIEKSISLTEEVVNKINMMGIPVEKLDEENLEIEILANRPDLISMHGFLRAINAYLGKETGLKKYKLGKQESNFKVKVENSVSNIRPYTVCAIVKGIKFEDSKIKELIDIQEKIHSTFGRNRKKLAIGIYPLEKIKLPITYKAEKPADIKFIPLEMDREMNGLQILQNHPTGREYSKLLEGFEKFPIFTDATGKILSMPPIINSHETGKITENTREVFVECSGSDLWALKKTINIIVTTLIDMGGVAHPMEINYGGKIGKIITPDFEVEKVKINFDNVNKILGLKLKEKEILSLLPRMGYEYSGGKVLVPSWRTDIIHEVDIIEDLGIAYGYDKLTPEIPKVATIGQEDKKSKIDSRISEILCGLGIIEISTYYLVKEDEIERYKKIDKISLENSKTEYKNLRPNLIIPAIRILSENKDNEYPQKIFEIGPVFERNEKSETGIQETKKLIIALTPSNFTEIKRIMDYLSKMIQREFEIESRDIQNMIDGRSAIIKCKEKEIGFISEVHPEYLRNSGIKQPISLLEISIDELID